MYKATCHSRLWKEEGASRYKFEGLMTSSTHFVSVCSATVATMSTDWPLKHCSGWFWCSAVRGSTPVHSTSAGFWYCLSTVTEKVISCGDIFRREGLSCRRFLAFPQEHLLLFHGYSTCSLPRGDTPLHSACSNWVRKFLSSLLPGIPCAGGHLHTSWNSAPSAHRNSIW